MSICENIMDSSFILIGSTHGFIEDFLKQKEIILNVKPEFVLSEELENIALISNDTFEDFLKKEEMSNMTSFKEVEKLSLLCFENNIKLVGIDFENFGYNKNLQRKLKNKEEFSKEEGEELDKIISQRERKHLEMILRYKKKTSKPLVIVVGCWHLRKDGLLLKKLKDYKIIHPCDERGELLLSPGENKNIGYKEITSNDN